MILTETLFGLNINVIIIIMLVLIVVLFVMLAYVIKQLLFISRKYYTLTSGKTAGDLEGMMLARFKEMDRIKSRFKRYSRDHKGFKGHLDSCYNKLGLVKYDAFDSMAGELSFSLALLNDENSGFVLSTMHSKQGCFSYAKEIIKGESFIALSSEEKEAIRKARTIEEEIEKMKDEPDEEDLM